MKAIFSGIPNINDGGEAVVDLPFSAAMVNAIVIRRRDGALLGQLFYNDRKYQLPGGFILDGESAAGAIWRILEESNLLLIDDDQWWQDRVAVDYHPENKALHLWYLFMVDDVQVGDNEAVDETRWLDQSQDVWHPGTREKICLNLETSMPDLLRVHVNVLDSW